MRDAAVEISTVCGDFTRKGTVPRPALIYDLKGAPQEARQILIDVIENLHADENRSGLAFAPDRVASLSVLTAKPKAAAHLIGWSDANRRKFGGPRPRLEQADQDKNIAVIKAKIGGEAYETAYNAGQDLTLDEAVAFASGCREQA
jgi:hypothetical protein